MRKLFPGYFPKSSEALKQLWQESTFAFDANVLLNVYRYSPNTKESLYRVLGRLKDRLWLPHQAALEFHRNRPTVIADQAKKYEEALRTLEGLLDNLTNTRQHPFVSQEVFTRTQASLADLEQELRAKLHDYEALLTADSELDRIAALFVDCVGTEPEAEELAKLKEEAAQRLDRGLPPGFADGGKSGDRSLGDAVLWLQLLSFAESTKRSVILVTDDAKADWWLEVRGKTLGPRPELAGEFGARVGKGFHLYQPGQFLKFAAEHLGIKTAEAVLEEVDSVTRRRARPRRPHGYLAGDGGGEDVPLHAGMHREEIEEFLRCTRKFPSSFWDNVYSPFNVPTPLVSRIEATVRKCPCVVRLAKASLALSEGDLAHVARRAAADSLPDRLVLELRDVPQQAIALAELLCGERRSRGDYDLSD